MVTLKGVKLISREEMHGYPALKIENKNGEILTMRMPAYTTLPKEGNYGRDELCAQLAKVQTEIVDVTYVEKPWSLGDRSGVILYYVGIKESK